MNSQPYPVNNSPILRCEYLSQNFQDVEMHDHVFAVFGFGEPCGSAQDPRQVSTGLTPLNTSSCSEVWLSEQVVDFGIESGVHWSQNNQLLLATIWFDDIDGDLIRTSSDAYHELLSFIKKRGFNHPLRSWNYLSRINEGTGDQERYKQFCAGRHQAFSTLGYSPTDLPSACALGHQSQLNVAYILAGAGPGQHYENPRQTSAYRYPRQYGPRSPSFARATVAPENLGSVLFLSGTASITGHETRHPNQFDGQIQVTLNNIDTVLEHVSKQLLWSGTNPLALKVYVRNNADANRCKELVTQHFGADIPTVYVQADICREDLVVEIDGTFIRS